MMRMTKLIGLVVGVVLMGSCSSVSYMTDWDTARDYSSYDSFAWYELAERSRREAPRAVPNAIVAGRIQRATEAALIGRGLAATKPGDADLLVTSHVVVRPGFRVYHSGWGGPYYGWGPWGWGWGGPGWGGGYSWVRSVPEGTLIIDVLDGASRKLVWRGIADGAFQQPNPTDEQVEKVVFELLKSFPPR